MPNPARSALSADLLWLCLHWLASVLDSCISAQEYHVSVSRKTFSVTYSFIVVVYGKLGLSFVYAIREV
jgi:hypothetical protein